MKYIVSVSIGSSVRDHRAELKILGEKYIVERIGTDGDMQKALTILKELDGKADAFGMGGIDLYVYVGNRRYTIRDALPLKNAPKKTPIVDGSGLKNTLERSVIHYLDKKNLVDFKDKAVLLVSAADRFGMAQALESVGSQLICGDLIFTLGLPYPIRSLKKFYRIANMIAPLAVKMPFHLLYPTGKEQDKNVSYKYERFYQQTDIIAGDFHYIHRFMPMSLSGKTIITNTVTQRDIQELGERGILKLITTTPELMGRSFGTNVIEAILLTCIGKPMEEITERDYEKMSQRIGLRPRIITYPKGYSHFSG